MEAASLGHFRVLSILGNDVLHTEVAFLVCVRDWTVSDTWIATNMLKTCVSVRGPLLLKAKRQLTQMSKDRWVSVLIKSRCLQTIMGSLLHLRAYCQST
jgi:hypothetical protein